MFRQMARLSAEGGEGEESDCRLADERRVEKMGEIRSNCVLKLASKGDGMTITNGPAKRDRLDKKNDERWQGLRIA